MADRMPSVGATRADEGVGRGRLLERGGPGSSAPASRTIVIVDDEETLCEALKDVLEEEGYSVEVATNGVEAMTLVNRMPRPPGLIILDLSMPWMNGNAVYSALKADPRLANIPVIITTSNPSSAPRGVPVLKKPVDLVLLLETVGGTC
jgi:CheY-like chemotaxis protein